MKTPETYQAALGEDVPPASIYRHTLAGMAVAEAAASDHHVVDGIEIFVQRVSSASTQQSVAQREQTGEVYPNICHLNQILHKHIHRNTHTQIQKLRVSSAS